MTAVCDYFDLCSWDGTLDLIHHDLKPVIPFALRNGSTLGWLGLNALVRTRLCAGMMGGSRLSLHCTTCRLRCRPQAFCGLKRSELDVGPPGDLIALTVQLLMMVNSGTVDSSLTFRPRARGCAMVSILESN